MSSTRLRYCYHLVVQGIGGLEGPAVSVHRRAQRYTLQQLTESVYASANGQADKRVDYRPS